MKEVRNKTQHNSQFRSRGLDKIEVFNEVGQIHFVQWPSAAVGKKVEILHQGNNHVGKVLIQMGKKVNMEPKRDVLLGTACLPKINFKVLVGLSEKQLVEIHNE